VNQLKQKVYPSFYHNEDWWCEYEQKGSFMDDETSTSVVLDSGFLLLMARRASSSLIL
jgi:hypothetical protein